MAADLEDAFAGALLGQAVGDAVGFMVEGEPAAVCAAHADAALFGSGTAVAHRGPYPLGQYSDDTQLARELAASIVACDGFDAEDYARRIAALFSERRIVGGGLATAQAAQRLAAGVEWQRAGTPAPGAGNGSAMRAARGARTRSDVSPIRPRRGRCAPGRARCDLEAPRRARC